MGAILPMVGRGEHTGAPGTPDENQCLFCSETDRMDSGRGGLCPRGTEERCFQKEVVLLVVEDDVRP